MYVVTPADPIYHVALNDGLTLCGLYLSTNPEHRKRRDDRQLSETIPDGQFIALCSECDRVSAGKPKPKGPSPELLSPSRFIDIPIL